MKWGINWANDGDTMLPSDILGTHRIIEQLPDAWLRAHKINTHVHHEQSGFRSRLQKQSGFRSSLVADRVTNDLWMCNLGTSNQKPVN
jgi:hypothetical protein